MVGDVSTVGVGSSEITLSGVGLIIVLCGSVCEFESKIAATTISRIISKK
jgi:hypothetical protein